MLHIAGCSVTETLRSMNLLASWTSSKYHPPKSWAYPKPRTMQGRSHIRKTNEGSGTSTDLCTLPLSSNANKGYKMWFRGRPAISFHAHPIHGAESRRRLPLGRWTLSCIRPHDRDLSTFCQPIGHSSGRFKATSSPARESTLPPSPLNPSPAVAPMTPEQKLVQRAKLGNLYNVLMRRFQLVMSSFTRFQCYTPNFRLAILYTNLMLRFQLVMSSFTRFQC